MFFEKTGPRIIETENSEYQGRTANLSLSYLVLVFPFFTRNLLRTVRVRILVQVQVTVTDLFCILSDSSLGDLIRRNKEKIAYLVLPNTLIF